MVERKLVKRTRLHGAVVFAAVLAGVLLVALASARQDLPLGSYTQEPEVRIGVLLKADSATIKLGGSYKIIGRTDGRVLAQGSGGGTFKIKREARPSPEVPGEMYRVSLGSFKSFEDASFAAENLQGLSARPAAAYPDKWYLWFGPYAGSAQARQVQDDIRARGYPNARVEAVPKGTSGFSVYSGRDNLIATGAQPIVFQSSNSRFTVNKKSYRGRAEVLSDNYGTFTVVNLVGVENYLRGVVPREMPKGAHSEALKAQAIIARTYLLNNRHRHVIDGYELCATTDCQVYEGIDAEAASTDRAVNETRGLVVAYNGRLANALFHSTSGGRTANYGDVWTGDAPPYLTAVADGARGGSLRSEDAFVAFLGDKSGNDVKSKYYRWEEKVKLRDLEKTVKESIPTFTNRPGLDVGRLLDVSIAERADSGRVRRIVVSTTSGDYSFERDTIRWVLGGLRSTLFIIRRDTDGKGNTTFRFVGGGWGHSVGLCQMGAMKLANDGVSTRQILSHYYPGTTVVQLWK